MSGTITGTVLLGGGTDVVSNETIQGATFEGPGTLATTGTVTVVDGAVLTDGAVWTNQGTVDVSSGQIGGGPFNNQTNAVLNLTGDSDPFLTGVTLTNAGTIDSGSAGLTYLYATITDTGTIDISSGSGTLDFLEGGSFAGPVEGPGLLELGNGDFTIEPGFSYSGPLEFYTSAELVLNSETVTLNGQVTIDDSYIEGPGTLATTGTVTVINGAVLTDGAVWTNQGTVDVSSGQNRRRPVQ